MRLLVAAAIPLAIIKMITGLGGDWAYGTFGIISGVFLPITFIMFKFGAQLRMKSKHNPSNIMVITLRTHWLQKSMA